MPVGKICNVCGKYRDLVDYAKHHRTMDGRVKTCKYCKGKLKEKSAPIGPSSHLSEVALKTQPQPLPNYIISIKVGRSEVKIPFNLDNGPVNIRIDKYD